MPVFLVWFALHPDYHEFRIQEFESLCESFGVEKNSLWDIELPSYVSWYEDKYSRPLDDDHSNSFGLVNLPNEDMAVKILRRSVLVRGFLEVWSSASNHEATIRILKCSDQVRREYLERYISKEDLEFSWKVKSIGKKLSRKQQIEIMNKYGFLFKGTEKVNIRSPELALGIFEDWRGLERSNARISKKEMSKIRPELKRVYVGRVIGIQGDKCGSNENSLWWLSYSLNRRPILGPTTLDNELAFIMCNVAQVKENDIVFDPFCGTGGILISASHLGAICFGSDLDLRVINGWFCSYVNPHMIRDKTVDENISRSIFTNFDYYNLKRPNIIRMDISNSSIRGKGFWIDAIVCDPPYGIRATSRTTVFQTNEDETRVNNYISDFNHRWNKNGFPPVKSSQNAFGSLHSIDDMINDLLIFSACNLVDNGNLVFLLPLLISESASVISALINSSRPAFKVNYPYLQVLGGGLGRLLVHMTLIDRESFRTREKLKRKDSDTKDG